tara:strand:- start:596 stop:862 length:267 start_codon:yes stop_codon:yes gene_type:complete
MYGKKILGLGAVKTKYFLLEDKKFDDIRTIALGKKTVKIRRIIDKNIIEFKLKKDKFDFNKYKKIYTVKPISYVDFLTVNKKPLKNLL